MKLQPTPCQVRATARRGSAMLLALFFTMIVGLTIASLLPKTVFHHDNTFRQTHYIASQQSAEAGLEEGIWHLSYDKASNWDGWNTTDPKVYYKPITAMLDPQGRTIGEYQVRIVDPLPLGTQVMLGSGGTLWPLPITSESAPTITAVAGVPNLAAPDSERRIVEVVARARTIFSLGLFSNSTLDLGGTTVVNSFNSNNGPYHEVHNVAANGDAGSNENIILNGNVLIDGDAAAGGTVLMNGQAEISGEIEGGISRITLPSMDDLVESAKLANNNDEIPTAVRDNGQLVAAYNPSTKALSLASNATLTLPGGTKDNPKVYYFSSGKLNGNSTLNIDGYVVIMTDGDLDFNGGTIINNGGAGKAEQLVIYSSGGDDTEVKINGGAGLATAVYAPNANIFFGGGGHIYGAAVGGKITVQGNAQFHYDEALGDTGRIAYFEVNEWVERYSPAQVDTTMSIWDTL